MMIVFMNFEDNNYCEHGHIFGRKKDKLKYTISYFAYIYIYMIFWKM